MREDPKAEEALTKALEYDPDLADAYNGLGILQDREGNHDLAMGFYQRALSIDPESAAYHNNLGYSLLMVKDLDGAIISLREAVRRDPGFRKAHNNLGYAYGLNGDDAMAFEEFRLATDEAGAHNNLGYLYYQTDQYPKAAASFEKAIEASPVWYIKAAENQEFISGLINGTASDTTKEIP
jgi:Flp pilus assembly protein TadD